MSSKKTLLSRISSSVRPYVIRALWPGLTETSLNNLEFLGSQFSKKDQIQELRVNDEDAKEVYSATRKTRNLDRYYKYKHKFHILNNYPRFLRAEPGYDSPKEMADES